MYIPLNQMSKSKKTKQFQRLCNRIDVRRFCDLAKTTPSTMPRKKRGSNLWSEKWAKEKIAALAVIEAQSGRYLVRDGRRNPLNTTSSQTGAQKATVVA